jgi:uncharacterized protein YciI
MSVFAVITVADANWDRSRDRREQDAWDEHAAFMDGLVDEGFVFLGGPLDETRAMMAVEAADEAEVERRLADDPWRHMGILRTESIQPWTIWLDARDARPAG